MIKELNKECKFGQSKHQAKEEARAKGENPALVSGIYSQSTYNSYLKVNKQFIGDTIRSHREVKSILGCKKYVREFLEKKEEAFVRALSGLKGSVSIREKENNVKKEKNSNIKPGRHAM